MNTLLVALAWIYVVSMLALAQAFAPGASTVGALLTFVFWGLLPVALLLYIAGASARQRARRRAVSRSAAARDGGQHATGDPVAPKREEPLGITGGAVIATADAPHAGSEEPFARQ
jgi:hypothetical protein